MCGICGVALADRDRHVSRAQLERMTASLHHRGPDDVGVYVRGQVGLGHRRLSIVDVQHGHQPMSNEAGTVWITYNGEVYNHADFRSDLLARGHTLRTRCDTEAIVHLHEDEGADAARLLRGMFAYAIWDETTSTLTLARDHSGIKPLYYAQTESGDLVFGSEIKALFASGMIDAEIDAESVPEYLALGYVTGPRTLYRGIRKLRPGHVLVWQGGVAREIEYWRIPDDTTEPVRESRERLADEFWSRFVQSVHSQLMADVPLGVFLSGGLDSSLIVAAMRECGVDDLKTFSVGFAEREASELPAARQVAQAFRTDHHQVQIDARDFFDSLELLTGHRDQPLTFSASIPLYFVSRLAVQDVKVVLTGEGSDELFAGYGRYPRALWNHRLAATLDTVLPKSVRRAMIDAVRKLGNGYGASRLRRSGLAHHASFEQSFLEAFAELDASDRAALLRNPGSPFAQARLLVNRDLYALNPLEAMLRYDQATYLEELLMKQDQCSMAVSLESRVPYLDHPLLEWAATLPASAKLDGFTGKALVRTAAAKKLPSEIAYGVKRGFPLPLGAWLRGPGRRWLEEYLPETGDAFFDVRYARQLLSEHLGGVDHTAKLWRLLAFQVWRRSVPVVARVEFPAAPRVAAAPAT